MRKLWILWGLLLVACGSGGGEAAPLAETITCTAAYRSSVEVGIERKETLTFTGLNYSYSPASGAELQF